MKNLYKQARAFYLRNKVSNFEFDCVRSEIYATNKSILCVCSFVSVVLFFILTLLSVVIKDDQVFRNHEAYGTILLVMIGIFTLTLKLKEEKNAFVMIGCYVFFWTFSLYTMLNGVYDQPDNYAVVFIVFEFAYPLLFVDKIKRLYINTLIAIILFSVLTFLRKEPANYKVDIFNAWVMLLLSYLPSFYLTKVRVREFSLRQIIESERDTDALTGLLNKAALTRQAKKSINTTKNGVLLILDLDYFKQINDTYGHFTGDNVLKVVGKCIQKVFRSSDILGRFGGDEFVVLMTNTDRLDMAEMRCNQLIEMLNSTRIFPEDSQNETTIHASVGFALYEGENDFDSLFRKSDKALYQAKEAGKDRACQYQNQD